MSCNICKLYMVSTKHDVTEVMSLILLLFQRTLQKCLKLLDPIMFAPMIHQKAKIFENMTHAFQAVSN